MTLTTHDPEAITDTVDYIKREWPDISDKVNCARWILRHEEQQELDKLCCFWQRHEAD